jgi:hypothetical protein
VFRTRDRLSRAESRRTRRLSRQTDAAAADERAADGEAPTSSGLGHDFARIGVGSPVPWRLTARPHSQLPEGTPAWTERGMVVLGEQALLAPPEQRAEILRHEAVHSVHQRAAGRDESRAARNRAERLASSPAALRNAGPLPAAPSLLAFPPQKHKSFDQIWIGHDGVIGEIARSGVTVRTIFPYKDLKIDPLGASPPKDFFCGDTNKAPMPERAKALEAVAKQTAQDNQRLPADMDKQKANLVLVANEQSEYRFAGQTPVIVVKQEELANNQWSNTLAHETGHAILEHHADGQAAPDAFALRVADLFNRAQTTYAVPHPAAKFDPKNPPSLTLTGTGVPAAIAMVSDMLWAGDGGHPWDGPHEFFTSAYAGSVREPALQKQIFRHYTGSDKAVQAICDELMKLLSTVTKAKAADKVKAPQGKALTEAKKTLANEKKTPQIVSGSLSMLVDPKTMPGPEQIKC